jgi:hypothetical protein
MKILFCLCAGLIFYALLIDVLLIVLFGIHLTAVLNTTLCLELTGSNGIFGDISDWFWLRNTTSSGSQHSDWKMHPLENWLLLKSDVQFPKVLGFDTWRISVPLFWATCRLFSILLLLWILESFLSVYIITLFTLVLLRHWMRVIVVWFFSLLVCTFCPFVTKMGSNFWFGPALYF